MLKLIRKNGGEVSAFDDSVIFNNAFLNKTGIIKDVGDEFDYYFEDNILKIKSGMGIVWGRQFEIQGTEEIVLTKPNTGFYYYSIYFEIDTRGVNEIITLKSTYKAYPNLSPSNQYPAIIEGDNLVKLRNGVANLKLLCVIVGTPGVGNAIKMAEIVDIETSMTLLEQRMIDRITSKIEENKYALKDNGEVQSIDLMSLFTTYKEQYLITLLQEPPVFNYDYTTEVQWDYLIPDSNGTIKKTRVGAGVENNQTGNNIFTLPMHIGDIYLLTCSKETIDYETYITLFLEEHSTSGLSRGPLTGMPIQVCNSVRATKLVMTSKMEITKLN